MKLLLVALVTVAQLSSALQITSGAKLQILRNFHDYVTEFLAPEQVSKAIDMAAVGIHRGRTTEDIIDDLEDMLRMRLNDQQIRRISQAHAALAEQLGPEQAENVVKRTRHVVAYSMTPAVEKVRLHSQTPETAYRTMLSMFTPEYVAAIKRLIRMTLSDHEFMALASAFRPIVELD